MEKILEAIKERWESFKQAKWHLEEDVVNGVLIPVSIIDKHTRRSIIHEKEGLKYGASEHSKTSIEQKASAIVHSPSDVHILLQALELACGHSKEKMEFHLQHASKQLRIYNREIKEDVIRRDYRS